MLGELPAGRLRLVFLGEELVVRTAAPSRYAFGVGSGDVVQYGLR